MYMAKKEKKNVHEVVVKIDNKEWTDACDKVFLEKQKTVKVDGFRKGKVPRNIYEKKFGKESLYLDAANKVIPIAYDKAIDESKITVFIFPIIEDLASNPFIL